MQKLINVFLLLAGLSAWTSCTHQIPSPNGGATVSANCSTDTVYFVNDVLPLLQSNCAMSGCHDNGTAADGVRMTDYANIMDEVKAGNAGDSKLYKVIIRTDNERMPPPPRPAFTTAQKELIRKWISQGAKNNSCLNRCNAAVFTYSGAVRPTLESKCVGCHSGAAPSGGVNLSDYTNTRIWALNGKLYGSIAHQSGFSPMPKNSAKLSDCEIGQVQQWIQAGALNN
jgi:uncharacterized membrane protein